MKKRSSLYVILLISMILGLATGCSPEGQSPTSGEVAVPNITLDQLLQELTETCFAHNIEGGEDPYELEVAVNPGCDRVFGNFNYDGDVGTVYREKIFIRHKGVETIGDYHVRPARTSSLDLCGPDEQTLQLTIDDGKHITVFEAFSGQTMGDIGTNQKLSEVCVSLPKNARR